MIQFKKGLAFTLAEVLIIIGIIGIVAEMTIPSLMRDFQDIVIKNQFKKSFATVNSALLGIKANLGYYPICYYNLDYSGGTGVECNTFFTEFRNQLKVIKYCPNNAYSQGCVPHYNGGDTADPDIKQAQKDFWNANCGGFSQSTILNTDPAYVLSDGTIIFQYQSTVPLFAMDINGFKKPNKWGFDVFTLVIAHNGDGVKLIDGGCQPDEGGVSTGTMLMNVYK